MKILMAIGGGEIGRPGYKIETEKIDRQIIRLTGKKHPVLLFIPTASLDAEGYVKTVKKYFGDKLGCRVNNLLLTRNRYSNEEIRLKILSANIIYVGGGNTHGMLKIWKKMGVDKILHEAWEKGIVISGLSAGAVCWFKYFSSDSKKFINNNRNTPLMELKGLNWINAGLVPHYDTEPKRRIHMKKMMKNKDGVAFGVENCCALLIIDDKYKIVTSRAKAVAHKVYWVNNKYHEITIPVLSRLRKLNTLLKKNSKT